MAIVEQVELAKVSYVLVGSVWIPVEEGTLEEKGGGLVWKNEGGTYFCEKEAVQAVRTK